jgi:hypothetical protein
MQSNLVLGNHKSLSGGGFNMIEANERFNIKEMDINKPVRPPAPFFVLERDVIVKDFLELRKRLGVHKEQQNKEGELIIAGNIALLLPQRRHEIGFEDSYEEVIKFIKRTEDPGTIHKYISTYRHAASAQVLFPNREVAKDLQWDKLFATYCITDQVGNERPDMAAERLIHIFLFFPEILSEIRKAETDLGVFLKEAASMYREKDDWYNFAAVSSALKLLLPEQVPVPDKREWEELFLLLNHCRGTAALDTFSQHALHMGILASDKVKMTSKGLMFTQANPGSSLHNEWKLPERRRF